jgi:hypothetical protein
MTRSVNLLHLLLGSLLYFERARKLFITHESQSNEDLLLNGRKLKSVETKTYRFVLEQRMLLGALQILSDKIK